MYHTRVTVAPAAEPVALAELKLSLGVNNGTAEDTLLTRYITTARECFERLSGCAVITQSLRQYNDYFPHQHRHDHYRLYAMPRAYQSLYMRDKKIRLMVGPVQSITSAHYVDQDGVMQVLAYTSSVVESPAWIRVDPIPDHSHTVQPVNYIDYVAGFGSTGAACPASVVTAIMLLAQHFYESRSAYSEAVSRGGYTPTPQGFQDLVYQFKTGMSGSWGL